MSNIEKRLAYILHPNVYLMPKFYTRNDNNVGFTFSELSKTTRVVYND